MAEPTQVRCGGGGRWRDVDGQVVATPGLIGRGISTHPCGWALDLGADPPEGCPQCGGKVGIPSRGRLRPVQQVPPL